MNITKRFIRTLHKSGKYGRQCYSVYELASGLKECPPVESEEFEDIILALFYDGLIIISVESGVTMISLEPMKRVEIEKRIEKWRDEKG